MAELTPTSAKTAIGGSDAQLIWELVAEISDPAEILVRYGLTPLDLKAKMRDKMFRAAYNEAKKVWTSDLNIEERVKIKARYMVEDGLLDIFAILKSESMPSSLRMEAFEKLTKVGDLGPKKTPEAAGRSFSIAINFAGAGEKPVIIEGQTFEQEQLAAS